MRDSVAQADTATALPGVNPGMRVKIKTVYAQIMNANTEATLLSKLCCFSKAADGVKVGSGLKSSTDNAHNPIWYFKETYLELFFK